MSQYLVRGATAPSDPELISAVRGGDRHAYGLLFERHQAAALSLARQIAGPSDADDLVSDAFIKVLRVLTGGGGPDVAFRAYLLTAVRSLHIDRIRANSKVTPSDQLEKFDLGVPFVDPAVSHFENTAAAKAFASLPERWQLVLWHLEVENQKPAEVAPLLGLTPNSVSALAYRAREGLRQAYLQMHMADTAAEECRWVTERLGAHVRKGLSRRDASKVDHHLDECSRCAAVYLELTEVNSNLAAIIGPLLLGSAAAAYIAGSTGSTAVVGAVSIFAKVAGLVTANSGATAAGAVAVSAAAVAATVAIVTTMGPGDNPTTTADKPFTAPIFGGTSAPVDPSPPSGQPPGDQPPSGQPPGDQPPGAQPPGGQALGPEVVLPPPFVPTTPASASEPLSDTPFTISPSSPDPSDPPLSLPPSAPAPDTLAPSSPTPTDPGPTSPGPTSPGPTDPGPTDPGPTTTPPTTPPPGPAELTLGAITAILVDVTSNGTDAGDLISYEIQLSNSGESTLTGLRMEMQSAISVGCDVMDLAANDSTTCTATVDLYQDAVDLGVLTQEFTVTAEDASSGETIDVTQSATADFPPGRAELAVVAEAVPVDVDVNGLINVGDLIQYSFDVTNVGASTLFSVVVTDAALGTVLCPPESLLPGETALCTAEDYTISANDAIAGQVSVEATAQAVTRLETSVVATAPPLIQEVVDIPPLPAGDAAISLDATQLAGDTYRVALTATTEEPATHLRLTAEARPPVKSVNVFDFGNWDCVAAPNFQRLECISQDTVTPDQIIFEGELSAKSTITVDLETIGNVDPDPNNNHAEFTLGV
ncbi:MAG: sigma-70 family RNA polymerase sigma factor [Nocardioidaceae bacterium]|nr:sigma-70 family RNA polymerase sigma factor [Nocardioidaceae bacterium]